MFVEIYVVLCERAPNTPTSTYRCWEKPWRCKILKKKYFQVGTVPRRLFPPLPDIYTRNNNGNKRQFEWHSCVLYGARLLQTYSRMQCTCCNLLPTIEIEITSKCTGKRHATLTHVCTALLHRLRCAALLKR